MNFTTIQSLLQINNHKAIVYGVYAYIKHKFKAKLGRKYKLSLVEQITITLFKLKYNLPDRVLENLLHVDHVTLSRAIKRMIQYMSHIRLKTPVNSQYYVVDTTTIRIGKEKSVKNYSGYKHYHGVKFQVICDDNKEIVSISKGYESSQHDKRIFLSEYKAIENKLSKILPILGDKAYVGLEGKQVLTSSKLNEKRYKVDPNTAKEKNKFLNKKRVKIEHIFAKLKSYHIMRYANYYSKQSLNLMVQAIFNLITLQQQVSRV